MPELNSKVVEDDQLSWHDLLRAIQEGYFQYIKDQWSRAVFRPTDTFKMRWDILIMAYSLFNCFSVPIKVCFDPPGMNNKIFEYMNYVIDTFFFLDILISFRTVTYDDKGEEESGGW